MPMMPMQPMPMKPPSSQNMQKSSGVVTKVPHFYNFYTGPKLAELNAVKASAKLSAER